jgi:hypothetical protein
MTPLEQQARQLMRLLNVQAQPLRDEQYVQVSRMAIEGASVVGFRRQAEEGMFTGWEIVDTTEDLASARHGYYSVRELVALRPEWLVALQLPANWAFRFDGDTLIDCVSDTKVTFPVNMKVELS